MTLETRTPEDVLAVAPVVLGFEPSDSIVMLTYGGLETFHARVDLPPPDEVDEAVRLLLEPAQMHRVGRVAFVVYAGDVPVAHDVAGRLRAAFERADIDVVELLRAHAGRWWHEPGPAGAASCGVPYDAAGHRFRAQAVVEGIVVHRSREELQEMLRPVPDAVERTRRALRRALPSPTEEIADLVEARARSGRFTDVELARVLLGMQEPGGRDAAWGAVSRETASDHVQLWTDAVQRVPDEMLAGPAAVLGLVAWLAGHGALAWCAVDRCHDVDPQNTLAGLVADLLVRAVPPSRWPLGHP